MLISCGFKGIYDLQEELSLEVFPNPATEFVRVQSKEEISFYTISSLQGILVKQSNIVNHSEFDIDIHNLAPGIYILTLQTKSLKRSLKLVKE